MKKRKLLALVLAATLVASALTGCGGGDDKKSSSKGGDKSADAILKIGVSADVASFDPHAHNDISSANATRHIYNNLVKLTQDNEFVPDLAESWDTSDNMNVKFKLKPDVKFQNGDTLTSEDVKFSLERQKKSAKVGHLVSMIDNVEVVDDLNFIIHLNEPSTALISSLAHPGGAILDKKYTEDLEASGKALTDAPMGTGPYKFKNWKPGDSFELERYDDYFDKDDVAKNGGLIFKVIPEEAARTIALETGEIDCLTDVGAVDAQKIRDNPDLKMEDYTTTQIEFMAFNTTKKPFDNVKVRQAINYCVNRSDIIQTAMSGEADPDYSYIGIAAIGYSDDVTKYDYNLDKAKALLTEAGYPDGFEFTAFLSGDMRSRSAQVVQAALQQIGVTMKIEQMESATFYDRTGKGEHQACFTGWVANAEPDNTFDPLFSSKNIGPGGNRAFYSNPEVDALIADGKINHNEEERMQDYYNILKIVSQDAIWAPFYSKKGLFAVRNGLTGYEISTIQNHRFEGMHYE